MTRTPAPALAAEEARTIARFDAAEVPPEVVAAGERVERVARALQAGGVVRVNVNRPGEVPGWWAGELHWDDRRRLAAAAIAALPPQEPFDLDAACQPVTRQPQSTRTFRAALASPAPAPQETWTHQTAEVPVPQGSEPLGEPDRRPLRCFCGDC